MSIAEPKLGVGISAGEFLCRVLSHSPDDRDGVGHRILDFINLFEAAVCPRKLYWEWKEKKTNGDDSDNVI